MGIVISHKKAPAQLGCTGTFGKNWGLSHAAEVERRQPAISMRVASKMYWMSMC